MAERLRVGVVGVGWFSETVHLAGLQSHARAEVTALCARHRVNAEAVSLRHGYPVVFTDYTEMLASGMLDAVVIVTPDHLHHDMALQAFARGLHVLSEKPLARTAADARDMLAAAQASGRVHMMMFTWRWLAIPMFGKQLIDDGYIGHCREAQFSMQAGYADDPVYGWRFDPEQGSGISGDLGSHMIDMARWYLGEISRVNGRLVTNVARPGPDGEQMESLNDSAAALVEFASGACGTINVSAARVVGWAPEVEIRLYGDEGSLKLNFGLDEGRIQGRRRGDEYWGELVPPENLLGTGGPNPAIMNLPSLAPFTNLPVGDRLFVDAILDGHPAEPTFEDGWRVQEVIDAVRKSDHTSGWVSVSS